jgi:hypothetical protein
VAGGDRVSSFHFIDYRENRNKRNRQAPPLARVPAYRYRYRYRYRYDSLQAVSLWSWIEFATHITPFDITRRPPSGTIPMAEHGIFWYRFDGNEFQAAEVSIPQPPISKGRSAILSFAGTGTRGILKDIARIFWIQHAIVIVRLQRFGEWIVVGSGLRVGWVVGDGPVLSVAGRTPAPNPKKGYSIFGRQVVSCDEAFSGKRVTDDLEGGVSAFHVTTAIRDRNGFSLAALHDVSTSLSRPRMCPALDGLSCRCGRLRGNTRSSNMFCHDVNLMGTRYVWILTVALLLLRRFYSLFSNAWTVTCMM